MYKAAIVIKDGYDNGQRTGIDIIEYTIISYIYNYFNDYEIQQSGPIRKLDVIRAI